MHETNPPGKTFALTLIAETDDRFSDFSPYVASIDDAGTVAFTASLRDGTTGVFSGRGGSGALRMDRAGHAARRFDSHPDIDREGVLSVYGALGNGHEGVMLVKDGEIVSLADTSGPLARVGPLGPTMNDRGAVAFRADTSEGRSGVFVGQSGSLVTVADTSSFVGFQGLPVINDKGTVVFRADGAAGGQGIYMRRGRGLEVVAATGGEFRELGFFPSVNGEDAVVFAATRSEGGAGIFRVTEGRVDTIVDSTGPFASLRGALINDPGQVFFYATPRGGKLGIYAGADPVADAVLSFGDLVFGSTVVDLALNPVSINARGQLAIRIGLADGRQMIVRSERR